MILAGGIGFLCFGEVLSSSFNRIRFNEGALTWMPLLPVTICCWVLKEGVSVLFPQEKDLKILHEWPDYKKLKVHFNVGVVFCVLLTAPCLFIWLFNKLESFEWAWIFCVCVIALLADAYSVYSAKIELKSVLVRASKII
ncbi:MAG: hypothetical protein JKY11_00120 [Alphaproteobacteria bacterium]|nr:hypothetical protein [Alphaproteobacteria bacterium]